MVNDPFSQREIIKKVKIYIYGYVAQFHNVLGFKFDLFVKSVCMCINFSDNKCNVYFLYT